MSSMGMDKSGDQSLPSSVWTTVISWTVRAGFPATSIVSDALVMDENSAGQITFEGNFSFTTGTQQFRVRQNGVVVGAVENTGVVGNRSVTVAIGDTIDLQAFGDGFSRDVQGGAANTYVYYTQLSTNFDATAGDTNIAWGTQAQVAVDRPAAAQTTVAWGLQADTHLRVDINEGAQPLNWAWQLSADTLFTPAGAAPPALDPNPDTAISVHTADGRSIGDFPCNTINGTTWGREAVEVSMCDFDVPTQADPDLIEDLRPWVHWITVWENENPVWTGPIQRVNIGKTVTNISARDPSTFMWRTRVPVTRTWVDTSPARVADELWQTMFELHRVRATPVVLPGAVENTFTISAHADQRMLHQLMDDLTKLGLQWTVVAGRPVLGTFDPSPVAELAECDFMVEIERLRDGTATFNDVRVQGQNWAQTAVAPLAGLHLQTLVSLDDMFGASNIQRATLEYAKDTARIRDVLVIPSGATLHPDASVTMNDLIPGKTFIVNAQGISQLMRLDQVIVSSTPGRHDVQVTLIAITDPTEVAELVGGGQA